MLPNSPKHHHKTAFAVRERNLTINTLSLTVTCTEIFSITVLLYNCASLITLYGIIVREDVNTLRNKVISTSRLRLAHTYRRCYTNNLTNSSQKAKFEFSVLLLHVRGFAFTTPVLIPLRPTHTEQKSKRMRNFL